MQPSRREFLRAGVGSSTLLACGLSVPTFLARTANALGRSPANGGRVLVVLQLDGGNDGLNTVVPYGDDNYRKHRPHLQGGEEQCILASTIDRLAPGADYPVAALAEGSSWLWCKAWATRTPNRSHFESMAIWHAGRLQPDASKPGWLARAGRAPGDDPGATRPPLHISSELLPHALYGSQRQVHRCKTSTQLRRRISIPERRRRQAAGGAGPVDGPGTEAGPDSLLQFVQRSTVLSYTSSARLEDALHRPEASGAAIPTTTAWPSISS